MEVLLKDPGRESGTQRQREAEDGRCPLSAGLHFHSHSHKTEGRTGMQLRFLAPPRTETKGSGGQLVHFFFMGSDFLWSRTDEMMRSLLAERTSIPWITGFLHCIKRLEVSSRGLEVCSEDTASFIWEIKSSAKQNLEIIFVLDFLYFGVFVNTANNYKI